MKTGINKFAENTVNSFRPLLDFSFKIAKPFSAFTKPVTKPFFKVALPYAMNVFGGGGAHHH